jgi:hypothetical protein
VVPRAESGSPVEQNLDGASTGKYVTTRMLSMPTVLSSDSAPPLPTLSEDLLQDQPDPHTRRTLLPRRTWPWMVLAVLAAAAIGSALRLFLWR